MPPVDPLALVKHDERLACGITAFDAWVANGDRHDRNVAFDKTSRRTRIFDHGLALLKSSDPLPRLQQIERDGDLGINGSVHCLSQVIQNVDLLYDWCDRISQIPELFLRDVLEDAKAFGLDDVHRRACADFLLRRRESLPKIITANMALFPNAPKSLFQPVRERTPKGNKRPQVKSWLYSPCTPRRRPGDVLGRRVRP